MKPDEIRKVIKELASKSVSGEEAAWDKLRPLGQDVVPYLREAYPAFKRWQGRVSLLFHSIRYARTSEDAFQLGLEALGDKSTLVRYRACCILAYSLRQDALEPLRQSLSHVDDRTSDDASAAIKAIESQNHHRFVDRTGSGNSFWVVNDSDRDTAM